MGGTQSGTRRSGKLVVREKDAGVGRVHGCQPTVQIRAHHPALQAGDGHHARQLGGGAAQGPGRGGPTCPFYASRAAAAERNSRRATRGPRSS
eukprot:scaffold87385_cov33-Tisochrysis_lutea.AAC.3